MKLEQLQKEFFKAVTGLEQDFTAHVVEQGGINKEERVSIYRNAYISRLKETIENDHEILGLYLGDELFDKMAAGYIENTPSSHRSLRFYAEALPGYLQQAPIFKVHPIISELAQFERLLLHAFDAAEAKRADIKQLQKIPEDAWPQLTFRLHPSVQILSASTNAVECWQALKSEQTPPPAKAEDKSWLIWRNRERLTEFASLSNDENAYISYILAGFNFSQICDALSEFMNEDDVSAFSVSRLLGWLDTGVISELVY